MSTRIRIPLAERTSSNTSNNKCIIDENRQSSKFPVLKSKGRALTERSQVVNRGLDNSCVTKKTALERQRENASRLASGRSVVKKADKENAVVGVKEKSKVKEFISKDDDSIQPKENINKLREILEDRQNQFVKPGNVYSLGIQKQIKVKKSNIEIVKSKKTVEPIVEEPELEVKNIPEGVRLIDKGEESNNEFLLGIYADDIYKFLKSLEIRHSIRKDYLTPSHVMKYYMRHILVDWLFEVQQIFKLLNETIHLAIALLDRFMQDHPGIPRNELQLVGVSCIFLASKYEEMFPPDLDDFMDISAKTYSKMQIIKMEQFIFSELNYEMGRPSPLQFLKRYARAGEIDQISYCLAKYFIDLSLLNYCLCHVPPSLMAASALYLSLYLLNDSESEFWTPTLIYYSEYTWEHLNPIVCRLASVVVKVPTSKYQTVRDKYLDVKVMHSVSALPELYSQKIYKFVQEYAGTPCC